MISQLLLITYNSHEVGRIMDVKPETIRKWKSRYKNTDYTSQLEEFQNYISIITALENGETREMALDFNGFDSEEIIKK